MGYAELLKDPRWQKRRLEIFNRDLFTCQSCYRNDKTLCIHHMKYVGLPWECPDKYLITLCEDCHDEEEDLKSIDWYNKVVDSGLTRKNLLTLIRHVNYYLSLVDHRDFFAFHDILKKIVPDENLKELVKHMRENG